MIVPIIIIVTSFIVSFDRGALFIGNHTFFLLFIFKCIFKVPDAPIWLLSKNRPDDALKALQWLRGWVAPPSVAAEFEQLKKYKESSYACNMCIKINETCKHPPPSFSVKLSSLLRKEALQPLFLVVFMFFIGQFTGLDAMRTYLVQIMYAYNVPLDPKWATVSK